MFWGGQRTYPLLGITVSLVALKSVPLRIVMNRVHVSMSQLDCFWRTGLV